MSEFTDDTLGRHLAQQPGMREALLTDPVQNMQVEALRQTLSMVERALVDEGVPDDVRRRVINRVVWGEPEGSVDVHARMRGLEQMSMEQVRAMWHDAMPVPDGPTRTETRTFGEERPVSGEETNG